MHAHSLSFQGFSISFLKGARNTYQSLNKCTCQHVSNTNPFKAPTKF